jgi:AmmeMemoRadiSam system protein A
MAPGHSPEPAYGRADRATLLEVAAASVEHGLKSGAPLSVDPQRFAPPLRETRASFVTLRIGEALRGCTGCLEAERPLVADVARNAYRSAFGDPRFPPLSEEEFAAGLRFAVSVLSPLEPLPADSRAELLAKLRPGIDGLVLREGRAGATFLPAVWESLPGPARFLAELFRKAGLPPDHWSPRIAFERYAAEEIC